MKLHYYAGLLLFLLLTALQGSALSDLAGSLQPGQWGVLSTNNFQNGDVLFTDDNGTFLEYTDEAQWDPVDKKLYIMGTARGQSASYGTINQKWITYDEATNAWTEMQRPSFYWGYHGYDHAALDPGRRHYYVRSVGSNSVYRYNIANGQWTSMPNIPSGYSACCNALEYFPEMDRVVFWSPWEDKLHLFNPNTNAWVGTITCPYAVGNYISNITEYDQVNGVLYFSGRGDGTDRRLFKLDSAGTVTRCADAPVALGISGKCTQHTMDPVTGKFLVFETDRNIYEYNPSTNSWRTAGTHPLFAGTYQEFNVSAKIPEYGVVMTVSEDGSNSKVYLYRHSAGGTNLPKKRPLYSPASGVMTCSPNPAVASVHIRLSAWDPASSRLVVLDARGRMIADLTHRVGRASVKWSTSHLPAGVYTVVLTGKGLRTAAKVIVFK